MPLPIQTFSFMLYVSILFLSLALHIKRADI